MTAEREPIEPCRSLSRKNQAARWLLLPMGVSLLLGFVVIAIPNSAPEDSMAAAILLLLLMIAAILCWLAALIVALVAWCKGEPRSVRTLGITLLSLPLTAFGFWMAVLLRFS